jgi:predicted transcriptional regulator
MKQALIQIRPDEDAAFEESIERAKEVMRTGIPSDPLATFTFSSHAQLFAVFTAKRFELMARLQKTGPSSVRGLARSLGRDVRRVHDDVAALIDWGIVERNEDGKVLVPFDVIRADFDLSVAA